MQDEKVSLNSHNAHIANRAQKAKIVFLPVYIATFAVLVLYPIWDMSLILSNPAFMYFLDSTFAEVTIGVCCVSVAIYILIILSVPVATGQRGASSTSVLMILTTVMTAFGLTFLLLGQSFDNSWSRRTFQLQNAASCASGRDTQVLFSESQDLFALRNKPDCAPLQSVELCDGYDNVPHSQAELLKFMEDRYFCTGFCMFPLVAETNATRVAVLEHDAQGMNNAEVPLLPASRTRHRQFLGNLRMGEIEGRQDNLQPSDENGVILVSTSAAFASVNADQLALFSTAQHERLCSSVVALEIAFQLSSTAQLLMWEGFLLVFCSVMSVALKMCALCCEEVGSHLEQI